MEWLSGKKTSSKSTSHSKEEHKNQADKPKKSKKLKGSSVGRKKLACGATMEPDFASMVICADDSFGKHLDSCAECKRKFDLQTKKNKFIDLNEDLNGDDLAELLK